MKIAILVSNKDPAGMNIRERLLENYDFKESGSFQDNPVYELNKTKIYTLNKESIFNEHMDREIDADLFIFATKHESASKIPSLSMHTQGNWAKAEFGGEDRTLAPAMPNYLKESYLFILKHKPEGFDVVNEVTHHGPAIDKPCMFIEIGSSEEQWLNKEAAKVIAKTIMHLIENPPKDYPVIFGIGGLHTCPLFNKVVERTEYAIGHVCPKYMLEHLDKELIQQAIDKSSAELVVVDWKGLGQYKEKTKQLLEELNLDYKKVKDLLKDNN